MYAYINGIKYNFEGLGLVADQTDMEYLECGKLFKSNYLCIGGVTESNGTYNGYLQDLRISKKAVYTGNFYTPSKLSEGLVTEPSEPSCSEVALIINSDNTNEADASQMNQLMRWKSPRVVTQNIKQEQNYLEIAVFILMEMVITLI